MTMDSTRVDHTTNARHILVVDDSKDVHVMLGARLGVLGYELSAARGGQEALDLIAGNGLPDLVLLDIMMPGMDGFQLAEELQQLGPVPIICLSALADTDTKVDAISRFADDYITKPYAFPELAARIQRVLRRTAPKTELDQSIRIDARLSINFRRNIAVVDDEQVPLTPTETRILRTLYNARGELVKPEELLAESWDATMREGSMASLWVHVRRLRTKIEADVKHPQYIVTMRGRGYCMPLYQNAVA